MNSPSFNKSRTSLLIRDYSLVNLGDKDDLGQNVQSHESNLVASMKEKKPANLKKLPVMRIAYMLLHISIQQRMQ